MTKSLVQFLLVVTTSLPAAAQDMGPPTAPYCNDLKRLSALAMTRERFLPIVGQPHQGNFSVASLTLTGWQDCVTYGTRTYSCDSNAWATQTEAVTAQATFLRDIKACLGEGWGEVAERSSSGYSVLHDFLHPISITLSIDRTEDAKHVVRFILFIRGSETPR
jgi:hypothetical protein